MARNDLPRLCTVDTCERIHAARGYCQWHYQSIYLRQLYGNPYKSRNPEKRKKNAREYMAKNSRNAITLEHFDEKAAKRFWAKVDKTKSSCWVWTGARTAQRPKRAYAEATEGYGAFLINKRPFYAHRLSYLVHNGPLIDGLVIDHKCNNTLCVNPKHLQQMTSQDNVNRSTANIGNVYAQKSICKYGHPREPASGKPCKTCLKIAYHAKKAKKANG
jgi:hypothetical protein